MGRAEDGRLAVSPCLFAQYAQADLDRWRVLIGADVVHTDVRWGVGRVNDVRWGSCGAGVPRAIQIHVRYPKLGPVVFRPSALARQHRKVTVPPAVRSVIGVCYEQSCDEDARERLLMEHSCALREARDREQLQRAEALRARVAHKQAFG